MIWCLPGSSIAAILNAEKAQGMRLDRNIRIGNCALTRVCQNQPYYRSLCHGVKHCHSFSDFRLITCSFFRLLILGSSQHAFGWQSKTSNTKHQLSYPEIAKRAWYRPQGDLTDINFCNSITHSLRVQKPFLSTLCHTHIYCVSLFDVFIYVPKCFFVQDYKYTTHLGTVQ